MVVESLAKPPETKSDASEISLLLKSPHKAKTRKIFFAIHRWAGAIAAIYILIMSLTGVSLVFYDELNELLCPPPQIVARENQVTFTRIIENTKREFPGYNVTGVIVASERLRPTAVFAAKDGGEKISCEVDPYTGAVLGKKKQSEVLKFIRDLHFNLLAGKTGRMVNGVGAAALLLVSLTGVIVWWRGVSNWLAGFKMQLSGNLKRVNWNLHSALGAWVLPFLVLQSIGGFYFGFPQFFEQNLNRFAPVSAQKQLAEPDSDGDRSSTKAPATPPTIDQLVEIAKEQAKDSAFVERIAFPDKRRSSVRIWLKDSIDADTNAPRTQVFLAPKTGEVLAVSRSDQPPAGDQIIQWLLRFHFGTWFGITSKCAWLLVGLTPAILSLTGLYLFTQHLPRKTARTRN